MVRWARQLLQACRSVDKHTLAAPDSLPIDVLQLPGEVAPLASRLLPPAAPSRWPERAHAAARWRCKLHASRPRLPCRRSPPPPTTLHASDPCRHGVQASAGQPGSAAGAGLQEGVPERQRCVPEGQGRAEYTDGGVRGAGRTQQGEGCGAPDQPYEGVLACSHCVWVLKSVAICVPWAGCTRSQLAQWQALLLLHPPTPSCLHRSRQARLPRVGKLRALDSYEAYQLVQPIPPPKPHTMPVSH